MSTREKCITIQDGDQTLTFKIRRMPATRLETWLYRAGALLAASGLESKADLFTTARTLLEGNAVTGLGGIDFEKVQPLLDELLACCSRVVENVEERCMRESMEYVQDVRTLFTLRREATRLNFEFLNDEAETA